MMKKALMLLVWCCATQGISQDTNALARVRMDFVDNCMKLYCVGDESLAIAALRDVVRCRSEDSEAAEDAHRFLAALPSGPGGIKEIPDPMDELRKRITPDQFVVLVRRSGFKWLGAEAARIEKEISEPPSPGDAAARAAPEK